jgi:hypothetical protein
VEWSLNIKTEVLVELTLLWLLWVFVSIDNVPLLVDLSMFVVNNNVSVFSINITLNIEDLTFFVDNESTF